MYDRGLATRLYELTATLSTLKKSECLAGWPI